MEVDEESESIDVGESVAPEGSLAGKQYQSTSPSNKKRTHAKSFAASNDSKSSSSHSEQDPKSGQSSKIQKRLRKNHGQHQLLLKEFEKDQAWSKTKI